MQLDVGELRDTIDGEEHVHLAFGATQLADIDMNIADRGLGKAPALGCSLLAAWQSGNPMPGKAAMERAAGEFGDALAQAAKHVIEREQGTAAELDDDRLFGLGQH